MQSKVLSTGIMPSDLPKDYVRQESDRPRLSDVKDCENLPVINLSDPYKDNLAQLVGDACRSHGFFQVIDHGVSQELMEKMMDISHEFFNLPVDVKMKYYSDDPSKTMRLSTSFNMKKETVHNWRDYLRLHCHPLEKYVEEWPSVPSSFNVLSTGIMPSDLPKDYVRSASDRPRLFDVKNCENLPVISLSDPYKDNLAQLVGDACRSHGFFQVIDHGVSQELMEKMMEISHEFFNLPVDVKMKYYSDDPSKTMRLSTSFNMKKETVHNWRDYLRLHCHPLEKYVEEWPSVPSSFKDVVGTYCKEVRALGLRLLGYISLSLGLEQDSLEKVLGDQGQHMAMNYYPPCPEPELTYGLPRHTDPNAITILLQDQQVAGLQVLHHGEWVAVNPYPNAFVVNIGDQIQALSNGRYTSVWHRAIVNNRIERISVASFLCPADDAVICPATKDGSPAVYRKYTYDEYYKMFWSGNLDRQHCLELFKN